MVDAKRSRERRAFMCPPNWYTPNKLKQLVKHKRHGECIERSDTLQDPGVNLGKLAA